MAEDELERTLKAAVTRGIITDAQATAIGTLRTGDGGRPDFTQEGGLITAVLGQRRGFSAATIAYSVGALTVVAAMGWFLSQRWQWLGGWGVLAVLAVYAALFLTSARVMRREGFHTASGLAVLLTVMLAPMLVYAFDDITRWFSVEGGDGAACRYPEFLLWNCRGEELVAELVLVAAALIALRAVRFGLLVAPIAMVALRLLFHVNDAIHRGGLGHATSGWTWAIGASAMAAAAYAVERQQDGDEDFAFWLHCTAVIAAVGAAVTLTQAYPFYRHLLVPGAFVVFALSLLLRRRPWMLLGVAWSGWYVVWLASDVFRGSPAFPIVLALLGLAMIIATVWVQRNAALLAHRFGAAAGDGRPRFPGGVPLLLAPALVAVLMMAEGAQRDHEARAEQRWRNRLSARRMVRENVARRKAMDEARATPTGGETANVPEAY